MYILLCAFCPDLTRPILPKRAFPRERGCCSLAFLGKRVSRAKRHSLEFPVRSAFFFRSDRGISDASARNVHNCPAGISSRRIIAFQWVTLLAGARRCAHSRTQPFAASEASADSGRAARPCLLSTSAADRPRCSETGFIGQKTALADPSNISWAAFGDEGDEG